MADEITTTTIRPTTTVGLLGVEVDAMIHDGKHITNLRLNEIERRILAIEARLNGDGGTEI